MNDVAHQIHPRSFADANGDVGTSQLSHD